MTRLFPIRPAFVSCTLHCVSAVINPYWSGIECGRAHFILWTTMGDTRKLEMCSAQLGRTHAATHCGTPPRTITKFCVPFKNGDLPDKKTKNSKNRPKKLMRTFALVHTEEWLDEGATPPTTPNGNRCMERYRHMPGIVGNGNQPHGKLRVGETPSAKAGRNNPQKQRFRDVHPRQLARATPECSPQSFLQIPMLHNQPNNAEKMLWVGRMNLWVHTCIIVSCTRATSLAATSPLKQVDAASNAMCYDCTTKTVGNRRQISAATGAVSLDTSRSWGPEHGRKQNMFGNMKEQPFCD